MEKGIAALFIMLIGIMGFYILYDMGYMDDYFGTTQEEDNGSDDDNVSGIQDTWFLTNETYYHTCEDNGLIPYFSIDFEVDEDEYVLMEFHTNIQVNNQPSLGSMSICFCIDNEVYLNTSAQAAFIAQTGSQFESVSMNFFHKNLDEGDHTIGIYVYVSVAINDPQIQKPTLLVQTLIP